MFLLANILYRKPLGRTVFTVHNCYQNYKLRNKLLLIAMFAFFKRVVCCSEAALESFPAYYKWLAGKRLCGIQNGVDINRVARILVRQHNIDNGQFTVVTVGRMIRIKNPLTVLSAFCQGADLASRLVFIGEGDLRAVLLTKIRECGRKGGVELTGLIPREKVFENLAQADLFVSASLGEGLPVAALEAMACGCLLILSDIPPHRKLAVGADFIPFNTA